MSTAQPVEQASPVPSLTSSGNVAPAPIGPATTALVPDEQIDDIVERLQRRYTGQQISRADLEGRVRGSYHQFDRAPIRAFVNVFVERLVRRSVDELVGHQVGASAG